MKNSLKFEYPMMIFRKEYNNKAFYMMGISKKDMDGKYLNGYVNVRFPKGIDYANKTKIYIDEAWLDFYLDKDNHTQLYIFAKETKPVVDVVEESKTDVFADFGNEIELDDSDLTF